MVLGLIVVLIVGSLVVSYLRNKKGSVPDELLNQNNQVENQIKTHTVAKGESLWDLAEKYYGDGFKWTEIATENKIANASVITEGQELTIPNIDVKADENLAAVDGEDLTTSADNSVESITAATYEVVKGDNLWNIAIRAYGDGYKWVEIAKENKLANPDLIHPGNVFVLPR